MSERFGPVACRRASQAARVLGWRPAEFWPATPAELLTALGEFGVPDAPGFDRTLLNQMMEHDNGHTRSG